MSNTLGNTESVLGALADLMERIRLTLSACKLCITKVGERLFEINSNNPEIDCNYDVASHWKVWNWEYHGISKILSNILKTFRNSPS